MSSTINIHGWRTPNSGDCPCDSCEYSHHVRGQRQDDEILYCNALRKVLSFKPWDCTAYKKVGTMDLYTLEKMAWNLLKDKRGNEIGFHNPAKTKQLVSDGKAERPPSVDNDPFD